MFSEDNGQKMKSQSSMVKPPSLFHWKLWPRYLNTQTLVTNPHTLTPISTPSPTTLVKNITFREADIFDFVAKTEKF